MYTAAYGNNGPFVIRYPRGQGEMTDWHNEPQIIPIGKGRKLRDGNQIALLSIGNIGNNAAKAIDEAEKMGISTAHYDMLFLKPIDEELLHEVGKNFRQVITLENGILNGGMGSAVLEFFAKHNYTNIEVHRIGFEDKFITHGSIKELQKLTGLDVDGVLGKIVEASKKI
jgi:1-deoxy-D-xylulose-5-phosphate synthase